MTPAAALALVACALGVVVVRRRPAAVALVAVQSLILAALALGDGIGHSTALAIAGAALIVKGLALPALLAWIVVRTPEPRLIVEERHALARAGAAIALALALVVLLPPLELSDRPDALLKALRGPELTVPSADDTRPVIEIQDTPCLR